MAEDARQEIAFQLNGQTFRARPTFAVVTGIEGALNQPARTLGFKALMAGLPMGDMRRQAAAMSEISLGEMAIILFWMTRDQKNAPKTVNEVGEILMEEGYLALCEPVGQFLIRAQRGNKEHLKEIERQAQSRPEEGATMS